MSEWEEKFKRWERRIAERVKKLEKEFFETKYVAGYHGKEVLSYFILNFFEDVLEEFEEIPEVRRWKLSAVQDFDLKRYLLHLWEQILYRYFAIMVIEKSNSGYKVIERSSGPTIKFSLFNFKEEEPSENIPSGSKALTNYYATQAEEIKKYLYRHGPSYKTFWLDKNYCQKLNEIFKRTMEKELKELDGPLEKSFKFVDEETGEAIGEAMETNVPRGYMEEGHVKSWKFFCENTVARFVNDLEEIRKEVYSDLRGYNYWVDVATNRVLPWMSFTVIVITFLLTLLRLLQQ